MKIDWLKQLDHADPHKRRLAEAHIASSAEPRYLQPLSIRAASRNPDSEALFCRYLRSLPARIAAKHAAALCESPNADTRRRAMQLIEDLPRAYQVQAYESLTENTDAEVRCKAMEYLSHTRKASMVRMAARSVHDSNRSISQSALDALQRTDTAPAARVVLKLLNDHEPAIRLRALEALSGMKSFRAWKRCLSLLHSEAPELRLAAAKCIHGKGGAAASKYLLALIHSEKDPAVLKVLFRFLSRHPDDAAVMRLLDIACNHEDPDIRRTAEWTLHDIGDHWLIRAGKRVLNRADEHQAASLLIKLGRSACADAGPLIASHIQTQTPALVRCAALEALGYLGQPRYLAMSAPLMFSPDPMIAYNATLATVQMAHTLDHCPDLVSLLRSSDPEHQTLIQVVLQFMDDAVVWDYSSNALAGALRQCLHSPIQNIRYHALKLVGKTHRREFLEPILNFALDPSDESVQAMAANAANELLEGDLLPLLEIIANPGPRARADMIQMLSRMRMNRKSAETAAQLFDMLFAADLTDCEITALQRLAQTVFTIAPDTAREVFLAAQSLSHANPWIMALGRAWLAALGNPPSYADRMDWRAIFSSHDSRLILFALETARQNHAAWAVPMIVDQAHNTGPRHRPMLQKAVKQILEM